MPNGPLTGVLRHLRRWAAAALVDQSTDDHSLQRFAQQRDEAAFDALMQRHGSLVLGVCRRILGDVHEAEDAFQATFLVLARRAGSLARGGTIAGWLYTVAYHVAVRAKREAARRRDRERQAATMAATETHDDLIWRDLRPVLDEELHRLPEKHRLPLLLCYLEGNTQEEAAALLGWSKGTVSGRLARAKELLRGRLTRRGVTLSAAALTTALTEEASAALPAALAATTRTLALRFVAVRTMGGVAAELARTALRGTGIGKGKALVMLLFTAMLLAAGTSVLVSDGGPAPSTTEQLAAVGEIDERRFDAYGDALPEGAVVRLGTVRLCQPETVAAAVFSPDGKQIATSGLPGHQPQVIHVWDRASGKEIRHFAGSASSLAFAADGRLAAALDEGNLAVWDVATGKQTLRCNPLASRDQPKPTVLGLTAVAFAPDGKSLAVAARGNSIHVCDAATGAERSRRREQASNVTFAPDGKTIASFFFMAKTVSLWDPATGVARHVLNHPENVISVAFSSDSRKLAVRVGGNKIFTWDVRTGKELHQLYPPGLGNHVRFRADGKALTTGLGWVDVASGKVTDSESPFASASSALALSSDGRLVLVSDWAGTLQVWDAATGKEHVPLDRHHGPISFVFPSADGKTIRTVGRYDQALREWDAASGKHRQLVRARPWQKFVAASADGRLLASPLWDGHAVLIDASSAEIVWQGGEREDHIVAVALTANADYLAVLLGDKKKTLRLWNPAKDKESRRLPGKVDDCGALALTRDGKTLAAAASLDRIQLWDVATGKTLDRVWKPQKRSLPFDASIAPKQPGFTGIIMVPPGKPKVSPPANLAFSPSGKILAVMSGFHRERWAMGDSADSGLIRLYDVASGKELFQFAEQEPVLAFSPDEKLLATGGHRDHAVYLWDATTGRQVRRLAGHKGSISALVFSADGRKLFSGSADSTVLVWDVAAKGK